MRELLKAPGIRLMSFRQADGYVRRLKFLSRLTLPEGGFDLGLDLPPHEVDLLGPTVELVAHEDLNPALSDLLIAAAREIHSSAAMFRKAGEFPAPLERDFTISDDAQRFYRSGTPFLYKKLPFWLASLVDRFLVVLVPLLVIMIPALRVIPTLYRWRVRSRIYRWYAKLKEVELELDEKSTPEKLKDLLGRLDQVERAVNRINTPLAYTDNLYAFRQNVDLVRQRVRAQLAAQG